MRYFNIAGLNVSIDDSNTFGNALCGYFKREEAQEPHAETDFIVRITDRAEDVKVDAKYTAVSGKFRFNAEEYSVRAKYYTYSVKHLFGGGVPELTIRWTRKSTPVNALRDLLSVKTIGAGKAEEKFLEKILNYYLFWYVFAVVLLNHGKCFVHSAIFAKDGKATVLAGSAGCGKTSTLLKVMEDPDARYLDEDFGILGEDGSVYYLPKRVTVYEEDADFGSPVIAKALKTLDKGTKCAWNFYDTVHVNRRVKFHPEDIFPGQVAGSMPLGRVAFVSRADVEAPVRHGISGEMLAEKIMSVSFRELKTLYELLNNIRGVGDEEILAAYPPVRLLEARYLGIMRRILTQADETCFVETPFKAGPTETLAAITGEQGK